MLPKVCDFPQTPVLQSLCHRWPAKGLPTTRYLDNKMQRAEYSSTLLQSNVTGLWRCPEKETRKQETRYYAHTRLPRVSAKCVLRAVPACLWLTGPMPLLAEPTLRCRVGRVL